jgi:hypothetical protein
LPQHLARFPRDGAVLTTGALTTHFYRGPIVLGSQEIAPSVLAHEFGHVLGFSDTYIRGYKDLGKNGFQVMEVNPTRLFFMVPSFVFVPKLLCVL